MEKSIFFNVVLSLMENGITTAMDASQMWREMRPSWYMPMINQTDPVPKVTVTGFAVLLGSVTSEPWATLTPATLVMVRLGRPVINSK